jgi:hypothetical protein
VFVGLLEIHIPHRVAQLERRPLQAKSRSTINNNPAQRRGERRATNLSHFEFSARADLPLTASPFRIARANRSAKSTTANRSASVSTDQAAARRVSRSGDSVEFQ